MKKILFVCTGNICRSPTAEGVFRQRVVEFSVANGVVVDSAGTHAYHVGEAPDKRSAQHAKKRGYDISGLKARKVTPADFTSFDLILGLDYEHVRLLERMAPKEAKATTALFLEYAGIGKGFDVPDPYYGGPDDFEKVLDLVEEGSNALLNKLKNSWD